VTRARRVAGLTGERLAERHLVAAGYVILARNYRCPLGEIDLVALDRRTVVFVEVKARHGAGFGAPLEALGGRQRRRIVAAATHYLSRHRLLDRAARFDVVGVWLGDPPRCELVRGAFAA
jgi:putative endonuclease